MPERCPIHGIEHPAPEDFATVTIGPLCPRCSPEGIAQEIASLNPLVVEAIRKQEREQVLEELGIAKEARMLRYAAMSIDPRFPGFAGSLRELAKKLLALLPDQSKGERDGK